MRRFWIIGGIAVGLAAVATAAALAANGKLPFTTESGAPVTTAPDAARPVRVHRVAGAPAVARTYTGVVKPRYESDLGFRVAGKVTARTVDVGERVAIGQTLVRLDPTDYELAVQIAEADLTAARADAGNAAKEEARQLRLAAAGTTSQSDLDRARDGRKSADARLDRAERSLALSRNRLSYCELKADADGVVTALPVEVGQVVAEGAPVVRVARSGELEAVVNLPENRVEDARAATRVTVWGESDAGYAVKLRELSPTADSVTRTYQARFTVRAPGPDVTIGRTVTVHLGAAPGKPTVTVPLTAVRQHGGSPAVWRVDGDRLVSVPVAVVEYRDDSAVVSDGLRPGDLIVAAGVQKLDAGLRVRAWEGK